MNLQHILNGIAVLPCSFHIPRGSYDIAKRLSGFDSIWLQASNLGPRRKQFSTKGSGGTPGRYEVTKHPFRDVKHKVQG